MIRLNEVRFIGNVGLVRQNEKSVYISVAINESYKPKDQSDWVEKTVWADTISFGNLTENIQRQGIAKGDSVLVVGKLAQNEYEGKKYLQVVVNKIQLLSKPKQKTDAAPESPDTGNSLPEAPEAPEGGGTDPNLPF